MSAKVQIPLASDRIVRYKTILNYIWRFKMALINADTNLFFQTIQTEVGSLLVKASDNNIMGVLFREQETDEPERPNTLTRECSGQLRAYFSKQLEKFDLPLAPLGTPFQQSVWKALQEVPFGKTISYLMLARSIGNEKAVRAVGHANGQNPFPIIVPCHRIIGQNGKLVGYSGGLWRKKWLLRHEQKLMQTELFFPEEN